MLRQLLSPEHIRLADSAPDWKKAIAQAAAPLIEDGSIEPSYIDAMVASVEQHGPYIVLDDYFALPHAQAGVGVNRTSMALLVLREPVDLLGNPVCIFLVLATTDPGRHLDALAELAALWETPGSKDTLRTGTKQQILELLEQSGTAPA